jgi:hypothetical protein
VSPVDTLISEFLKAGLYLRNWSPADGGHLSEVVSDVRSDSAADLQARWCGELGPGPALP